MKNLKLIDSVFILGYTSMLAITIFCVMYAINEFNTEKWMIIPISAFYLIVGGSFFKIKRPTTKVVMAIIATILFAGMAYLELKQIAAAILSGFMYGVFMTIILFHQHDIKEHRNKVEPEKKENKEEVEPILPEKVKIKKVLTKKSIKYNFCAN